MKRSASAPNDGMPFGNCLRVRFAIDSACRGSIRFAVRLATSASTSTPSIRSSGSSTFPFDFDIFWPSSSRTIALMYTSRNGMRPVNQVVVMIMRATQKKMMSKPVTSTFDGRNAARCGFAPSAFASPVQPSVEWHQSAEENQVSRTSSSRWKLTGSRPSFACAFARASASSRAT